MDDLYSDTFGPFVTDGCHSSPVAILNRDLWLGCLKSLRLCPKFTSLVFVGKWNPEKFGTIIHLFWTGI